MKMKTIIAAFAAIAASAAFADKVTLASGSSLTGATGVIRDGKVTFVSDDLGEIQIPVDKIALLESDKDHVVAYLDGTEATKKVTVKDGVLVEDGKKLDMAKVKAVDPIVETWHGSFNVSATATRGNTVGESATILADVSRRWEKDRLTAGTGYFFNQSGDSKETKQKTVSRFELQAQEDHFWQPKLYTYVNGKYEFDRIMDLEYRARIGAGLGYQWFEKRDLSTNTRPTTISRRCATATISHGPSRPSTGSTSSTPSSICPPSTSGPTITWSTPISASPTPSGPIGSSSPRLSGTTRRKSARTRSTATSATFSA